MSDISDLVQAIVALQPPRKVGMDEYVAKTPFHPDGVIHTTLRRRTFQNGRQLDEQFLTDEETRLVNRLVPGRFLDGLVTIKEAENGTETDLHIMYRSSSPDQRMALASHYTGGLKGLLTCCLMGAVEQGLAPPTVLTMSRNDADPLKSMVLPTRREKTEPPLKGHPAIPGQNEVPFEYPETTGTSADEAEEAEQQEAEQDESESE